MLDTSECEPITWFIHLVKNWIDFVFLAESVSSILQLLLILSVLFIIIHFVYSIIFLIFCICTFYFYIWKKTYTKEEYVLWRKPRQRIAQCLNLYAKIWHGHEIIGMENLPEGAGIIVYYHGAIAIDFALFVACFYAKTGRLVHSAIHYGLYLVPGIKLALDVVGCAKGTKVNCVEILKKGDLLGISPGGLREANFSDEYYNTVWGTGIGFAQVALETQVPIIPMFTQNVREAYRTVGKTRLMKWLYEYFRFLILPIYGGLPVKLCTYIGEPIPYDPNITAKELAEKAKIALENLRDRHQKRPGNILRALLERFDKNKKDV
ncbi:monoacylglycerol/Diacylglycerol O-acyltransferase-like [Pantherophis guttatus]|uniref:Monoacylglycerol/Diacylglycerol O-acyltransferase-like n=1 Tax=Pantherophis guttatus TaxID=94885 RepID=A0A6P9CYS2_PANGU|nr:monoacylglycerol/Diacylglycerol O-acyltransferase-like [Pantherophis guttatus]